MICRYRRVCRRRQNSKANNNPYRQCDRKRCKCMKWDCIYSDINSFNHYSVFLNKKFSCLKWQKFMLTCDCMKNFWLKNRGGLASFIVVYLALLLYCLILWWIKWPICSIAMIYVTSLPQIRHEIAIDFFYYHCAYLPGWRFSNRIS